VENKMLMKLNLAENNLTDKEISRLVDVLKKHPSLVELNLANNHLAYGAARDIATALKENKVIQKLHLQGNSFRVDSLWRLANASVGHQSLRLVNLKGVKLSRKTLDELLEKTKYKMVEIGVSATVEEAVQEEELRRKAEQSLNY